MACNSLVPMFRFKFDIAKHVAGITVRRVREGRSRKVFDSFASADDEVVTLLRQAIVETYAHEENEYLGMLKLSKLSGRRRRQIELSQDVASHNPQFEMRAMQDISESVCFIKYGYSPEVAGATVRVMRKTVVSTSPTAISTPRATV